MTATALAALTSPALAADAAMAVHDDLRDPVGHADQEMMSSVTNGLNTAGAGAPALIDRGDTVDDDPASGAGSTGLGHVTVPVYGSA